MTQKSVVEELASITKKRQQIHQSFMASLWRCELQTMYRYLLGIRRPPRVALHVGGSVHKSVELDLQNKISTGELLKRSDAIDLAAAHYDYKINADPVELDEEEKGEGKSLDQIVGENRDKAVALSGLHYDRVAPKLSPKYVEHPFSIDMDRWLRQRAKQLHQAAEKEQDGDAAKMLHAEARVMNSASRIGIDLVGTRDVVEEVEMAPEDALPGVPGRLGHVLRDSKTSTKSPNKMAAHLSEQMDIYSLASLVFEKQLPKAVVLDYLVQTPKRHDLKYIPLESTRSLDDVNVILYRFARAVHRWHTACKTGDFAPASPNDWWCSQRWCAYFDRCPAAKRPKLVQINTEIQE